MATRGNISDILAIKNNQQITTYDLSTLTSIVNVHEARLDTAEMDIADGIAIQNQHSQELQSHENRIVTLESVTGYSGSISVRLADGTTNKTMTFSNGILTGIS